MIKLKNILKGAGLILMIYMINLFIAFVIFSPSDSHTRSIIMAWVMADIALLFFLARIKYTSKQVWISAGGIILIFIIAYFLPLHDGIPHPARELNRELSEGNLDRYDYAEELFFEIEKKYEITNRQYLLEPHKVFFIRDFMYYWNLPEGEYADSNIQAEMYYKLLTTSGRFAEDEVKFVKWNFCINSPHTLVVFENGLIADFFAVDRAESINKIYEFGMYSPWPCEDIEKLK